MVDSPVALPSCRDLLRQPHFHRHHSRDLQAVSSWLETIQRYARAEWFLVQVTAQVGYARRRSLRTNYQIKWSIYRKWCRSEGHSISSPSLPKIVDFLFWLRRSKNLAMSSILSYRSMLAAIFRFELLEISSAPALRDLIRSFKVETLTRPIRPP